MSSPSTLWLTGLAGMGKTAISKSVCKAAEKKGNDIVLCGSFFCSRSAGPAAQRDIHSVVPTLAQNFAHQSVQFGHALDEELTRDPDVLHKHISVQVTQLLYKPLLFLKGSNVPHLFVIDGLDECGDNLHEDGMTDDKNTHRIISDLLEALVDFSHSDDNLPVKFFVTSRPETYIRDIAKSNAQ